MLNNKYTDGSVQVVYMFSKNKRGRAPSNAEVKAQMQDWGLVSNAIGLNDGERRGIESLFPGQKGFRDAMILRPGLQIAKTGVESEDFEREIDAVLAEISGGARIAAVGDL